MDSTLQYLPNIAILSHKDCTEHVIPNHVERPQRVTSILQSLLQKYDPKIFGSSTPIQDEQILLFHTAEHLSELKDYFEEAETKKKIIKYDGDTQLCSKTRSAVLHSAGSIINAIDRMYLPKDDPEWLRTAYCCVRPPGHHATPTRSMGFCFVNNAGIGARYAQEKYGVQRVAVLDFDVHHGNGTEDGFIHDPTLFYGSTHELGNYPGTGRQPPLENIKSLEMESLRQLVENDALVDQLFDLSKDALWGSVGHKPQFQVSRDHPTALTQRIVDRQIQSGRRSRYDFRIKWREILYEMIWFGPSLVIISAGFDAHDDDPLADLELTEEDYYWATEACLLACRCCSLIKAKNAGNSDGSNHDEVKCLSILEGGYNLEAISRSSLSHVDALFTSPYSYYEHNVKSNQLESVENPLVEALNLVLMQQREESTETQEKEDVGAGNCEDGDGGDGNGNGDDELRDANGDIIPKIPIEDILKGLDQSIGSMLMEALMSIPDQQAFDNENENVDEDDNDDGEGAPEDEIDEKSQKEGEGGVEGGVS